MNAMVAAAVWVKGPSDTDRMTILSNRERHFNIVLDTGAEISIVPKELFSMIWEAIEVEFGPDHVAQANEAYSTDDPTLAAYIDATGLICFRRSFTERLPVIGIQVADASTLEIRLSNHVQVCDEVWCRLQVKGQLIVDESMDFFILSNHFFADCQVSFDFGRKLIGLRAPRRPVTRKTSTVKSWNKRNGPACRKVVQRRTGIAWLVRSCIGEPEDD
ncbi:hypothetical protein FOL46_009592 [Perkinsus olseni]|uniref:Peptidase A1 domain-containing protein n=1 Tax=Perkinsus olseni TaxID=32597 RepID=A0A7J6KZP9_PEROL|nr:hypothetical protein FOL46_009592 [Perkinsus olseni]